MQHGQDSSILVKDSSCDPAMLYTRMATDLILGTEDAINVADFLVICLVPIKIDLAISPKTYFIEGEPIKLFDEAVV